MAKSLKSNGLVEVRSLRARITRQFGLGRIGQPDHDYLLTRAQEIEARIVEMREDGEDVGDDY